ncbi:MAG TPA: hypothetical protein VFQ92_17685 [Blastocatellia bacterium]|nr:hypothetical protein [Blastocatellia bacterium]
MKRRFLNLFVLLLLLASIALAQAPAARDEAAAARTLLFNVEILEFSAELGREIEKLAQDRARIDRLTSEGRVRPVADVLIRTRAGESARTRLGQRVPVPSTTQNPQQVQYDNTGLNITISPNLLADNIILVGINIELSAMAKTAGSPHPIFFQRTFSENVRMKPGERIILLSAVQQGALWPGAAGSRSDDTGYGNFVVLLTARVLD